MKRIILALSATMAMGFCAAAQDAGEVDIETSDVQLEMITPAQPAQETEQDQTAAARGGCRSFASVDLFDRKRDIHADG